MEQGLRRTGESVLDGTKKSVVLLSILLLVSSASLSGQSDSGVSGTVRDLHGKPQTGVLVELLGSATEAAAFTDIAGHYQIQNVLPGVYQLRASAALYIPSFRRQLRLQAKMKPVVNLTMSGLFDETSWMSSSRAGNAGGREDWKWTLRSPANRPMLRFADEDISPTLSRPEQGQKQTEIRTTLTAQTSSGGFGSIGTGGTLAVAQRSPNQRKIITFRSLVTRASGSPFEAPVAASILLQSDSAVASTSRVSLRVRTFPEIRSSQGDPLTTVEFGTAERMQLADLAALEVGSETQLVRSGSSAFITRPFLRVTSRPLAGWTAAYGLTTSSDLSHYDDVGKEGAAVPTVIRTQGRLVTEAGLHQEIVAGRKLGKSKLQILYAHDAVRRTALSGKMLRVQGKTGANDRPPSTLRDIASDSSDGAFRVFAPGSSMNGFGVALDFPLGDSLLLSGGYLSGAGVGLQPSSPDNRFFVSRSNAFLASIKGRAAKSGTRVSVTYRWQPQNKVSVVCPFEMSEVEPYLGVHLRQAVPVGKNFPAGVEVSVDGDNLAGEGYQSFDTAHQAAYLASALREFRAGLSLTF